MLLKLSKWCEVLGYKLKSRSLYYELKYYVKKELNHQRRVHYWDRGVGKSSVLIKLALENDIPIIVPTCESAKYLRELAKKHFHPNKLEVYTAFDGLRGCRMKMALIDEGLSQEQLDIVHEIADIVIGFRYIN